ncbi:hypothetical protein M3Y99_01400400 [Aphelenchoides fujianensis]|nr:hypothetical protein M3Y99_01400400 [Aphelenchoides fujianensis]
MEVGANTLIVCSSPTGQEAARLGLTTPSPLILTPRRSAMKRRLIDEAAQRPLTDSACTTPTDFRSPSVPDFRPVGRRRWSQWRAACTRDSARPITPSISCACSWPNPTRQRNLANHLKEMGITKIGEFASLSPSKVEEIPYLRRPKVDGAVNVLRTFAHNQAAAQQSSTADSGGPSNPLVHVDSSEKEAASPVESLTVDEPQENVQEERPETPTQPEIVAENNEAEAARSRAAAAEMQDTMEIVKTSPPTEIEERNQQPRGAPLVPRTQAPVVTSSQQSGGTASIWTDSSSEVNYARFQELQEKAADLSNLLNTTISAISKPKPSPIKMLRNIRAQFRDAAVSKSDCDQMLDLIMDLAKDVNQRRRTLADD